MADRAAELLTRPAAQSVRLIAQEYLDDALQALERLKQPDDGDALHDFRVALRRLSTLLRAYRLLLRGSVRRKTRRRLREIAEETNRVREAEVALAWLRPLASDFSTGERVGLRWLIDRVKRRRVEDLAACVTEVRRSFTAVARKMRKGLVEYRQEVAADGSVTDVPFVDVMQPAADEQARRLDRLLAAVERPDDEAAHRARIAAKRLRYLLEPVTAALTGGPALMHRLRTLQDLMGELHDLQQLDLAVRTAVGAAAAERAEQLLDVALSADAAPARKAVRRRGRHAGLVAIAKRIHARQDDLFRKLKADWLRGEGVWTREIATALPAQAPTAEVVPVPVASRGGGHHGRWARPRERR